MAPTNDKAAVFQPIPNHPQFNSHKKKVIMWPIVAKVKRACWPGNKVTVDTV